MHPFITIFALFIALTQAAPTSESEVTNPSTNSQFTNSVPASRKNINPGALSTEIAFGAPQVGIAYPAPKALQCASVEESGSSRYCAYEDGVYFICERKPQGFCYYSDSGRNAEDKICVLIPERGTVCVFPIFPDKKTPIDSGDAVIWQSHDPEDDRFTTHFQRYMCDIWNFCY